MKIFSTILDFLFPPSCPLCGARVLENGQLCPGCWAKFNWIGRPLCSVCGYPFPADIDLGSNPMCPVCASGENELDWMRSSCAYDDVSKSVMLPFKHAHQLKYRDMMARAMINSLRELGQRGNRKIPDLSSLFPIDMVMPVPLARRRLFKRGYNQAALLARPIARHFNVPVDYDSVRRKYRPDMGHKSYKQRKENIRSVFRVVRPENVRGRVILLADDVMTTGATFSELYKVLKQAGAKAIYGVTFCRVVRAI